MFELSEFELVFLVDFGDFFGEHANFSILQVLPVLICLWRFIPLQIVVEEYVVDERVSLSELLDLGSDLVRFLGVS